MKRCGACGKILDTKADLLAQTIACKVINKALSHDERYIHCLEIWPKHTALAAKDILWDDEFNEITGVVVVCVDCLMDMMVDSIL